MSKYKSLIVEATGDMVKRWDARSDKNEAPTMALEYVAALAFAEHADEGLAAVSELLWDPGRINSVWVGILLERHVDLETRGAWTEFCRPYRNESPRKGKPNGV